MRTALLTLLVCFLLASSAFAAIYFVKPDGTGDYPTIQAAIDASADGLIVELADGTFTGPGNRDLDYNGKIITVRSQSGDPEACIIDCVGEGSDTHQGFIFHSGETGASRLAGISIVNGRGTNNGGGLYFLNGSSPTIENCVITNCYAAYDGAGAFCQQASSPSFVQCVFYHNHAGDDGGALMCRDGSDVTLTDCTLFDNMASDAGGALYVYMASPTVSGCTLYANSAATYGSAFSLRTSATLHMQNTLIAGHVQVEPAHCAGGTATLACCDIYGNEFGNWTACIAGQLGIDGNIEADPLFCDAGADDLTLRAASPCAAENNPGCGRIGAQGVGCDRLFVVRPDGLGDYPTIQAAIDAAEDTDVIELTDGIFTGNGNRDLDYHEKAITVRSQSGDAEACIIDCQGSGTTPRRGFTFHSGEDSTSVLQEVTLRGGWTSSTGAGGAILVYNGSDPKIVGCIFTQNNGYDGAGMHIYESSPIVEDCTFSDNHATDAGGAMTLNSSQAMVRRCGFADNSGYWGGGAVSNYNASPSFYGCRFESNSTAKWGGGMLNTGAASAPVVHGCTFRDNTATWGGAMNNREGAQPSLSACTFEGNGAGEGGGLYNASGAMSIVDRSIISFSTDGEAVCCAAGTATLTCSDIYGNADGDWVGCIAGQAGSGGNLEADPRFCDAAAGDLTLRDDSPCAAENNPGCGQIGAHGVECVGAPDVHVTPPFLAFNLPAGGTQCVNLSIHNAGRDELLWWLSESVESKTAGTTATVLLDDGRRLPASLTRAAGGPQETMMDPTVSVARDGGEPAHDEPAHGEPDGWAGNTLAKGAGGPDAFGYSWIDSDDPAGPEFEWTDIRGAGTEVVLGLDDFETVVLPFSFPFYGVAQTSVKICSHAYLTFGPNGTDYSNDPIPTAYDPNDLIALFWDDVSTDGSGGTVHYHHDATNDRFIVQYTELERFGGGGFYTMEAILYPDGTILMQYLEMLGDLNQATIGIENADASIGLQVVANAAYMHDHLAVRIEPNALPWLEAEPTAGAVPYSVSEVVKVCVDADLAMGAYTGKLIVHSNDPDEPTVEVPVSLVVGTQDVLGLWTTHDGTGANHLSVAPATPFPVQLMLAGASRTDGLAAWEARLTVSPNVTIQNWSYQGTGLPMGGFPGDFLIAFTSVMPWQEQIWLGTVQAVVTDNNPGYFYLAAHEPSSIAPPAPCYIPGSDPATLVPMVIASGSPEIAVFTVNPDPAEVPRPERPVHFALLPCYPNPFNPSTTIGFELPADAAVRLRIYDATGRLVRSLIDGEVYTLGRHEAVWRGNDDNGRPVASGIYFCRIEAGAVEATRKMTLLK